MKFFFLDLSFLGAETLQALGSGILSLIFIYVPLIACMSIAVRKLGADLHARVGPSLSGGAGVLQPLFDFLKFVGQGPPQGLLMRERLALWLLGSLFCISLALLPLSALRIPFDSDYASLIPLLLILGSAQLLWLLTSAQGSITSLFSSLRYTSQVIAAQFSVLIALFTVALEAGGFSFKEIIDSQGWMPHQWNAVRSPFDFIAAVVFYIGGLILTQVSRSEAGFGVHAVDRDILGRIHGRAYLFFLIGRYYCTLYWALFTVLLFFGGWKMPTILEHSFLESGLFGFHQTTELFLLLLKSSILLFFSLILWKVNPRPRLDQVTQIIWRFLTPLALIALFGKMIWFIVRTLI